MTNKNKPTSLVPIQNQGIAKVEKSIQITNKILYGGIDTYFNEAFVLLNSQQKLDENENYFIIFENDSKFFDIIRFQFDSKSISDVNRSLELFSKVLEVFPKHFYSICCRGIAYCYIGIRRYKDAIQDFNSVIEFDSDCAPALQYRAYANSNLGNYKDALIDCERLILICPNSHIGYRKRGDAKKALKDIDGALLDYNKAIELSSKDFASRLARAWLYSQLGNWKGAVNDYDVLIEISNRNPEFLCQFRGECKFKMRDYSGAIEDFTTYISKFSNTSSAYFYRSEAKRKIGDSKGAEADFEIYNQLKSLE